MVISQNQFRVVILWTLLIIGMILHFNYHVSKIFYGIDVVRPGSNGTISNMSYILKHVFYHFPMLFVLGLLYIKHRWFLIIVFGVSLLYTLSHVMHVSEEFMKPVLNWAQIPLLSLVLFMSILLNKSSWDYLREVD